MLYYAFPQKYCYADDKLTSV